MLMGSQVRSGATDYGWPRLPRARQPEDVGDAGENVAEAGKTRQKRPKKRSLRVVNEHSEAGSNAVLPTQVVFRGYTLRWAARWPAGRNRTPGPGRAVG
ncbi:MAG: hypothetical protein DI537_56890 [Stutzerimonas stutzeri]|nr:MAG: hypothetical protein DI537_56890 [Stutzerimonas stutzeri]